ncbi:hypothetical protein HRG_012715 [Hirsutella rhossiliensis]
MSASKSKSLNELVRHHGALCVNPLLWTSPLLDLLGCRFEVNNAWETVDRPSPDDEASFLEYKQILHTLSYTEQDSYRLSTMRAPLSKRCSVGRILVCEGGAFNRCCDQSEFFFANRFIHRSDCDVFSPDERPYKHISRIPRLLVGYFHYTYVEGARRRLLRPPRRPGGGPNFVGQSIFRKKLSKVTPKEWVQDPYLVCVLLSLAQRQARALVSPKPTAYASRLLVTTIEKPDCEFIYLYEAEFTCTLLEMLDKPTFATERVTWPTIKLKRISFKPYKDFQQRIIAELLAPIP